MADENVLLVKFGWSGMLVLPVEALPYLTSAFVIDSTWDANAKASVEYRTGEGIGIELRPRSAVPTLTRKEYESAKYAATTLPAPAGDAMKVIEHAPPPAIEPVRGFVDEYRDPTQEAA